MTNEERDIIAAFIARVGGAPAAQPGAWGGTGVPATVPQALPPVDREADGFIAEQFQRYPEARYRMTQLAFVQEQALAEAQNRIKRMEWELQQTQQAAQQAAQQSQGHGGGFFSGLFGGGRSSQQSAPPPRGAPWGQGAQAGPPPGYQYGAPPPPQYPPGYNPGVFQRPGSGFLGSALTTAAGVAGGVLAADALRDLFSPHQYGGGLGGLGGGSSVIENNPWTGTEPPMPPNDPGYVDQGTWGTPDSGTGQPDQGSTDTGGWDQGGADPGGADQGGWGQGGGADQGGWDQGGGGGGSDDDSLI